MGRMVHVVPGAGRPRPRAAAVLPFSSYNPHHVNRFIRLRYRFNSYYNGLVLFGPCPRCGDPDGINIFIPTTWATVTAPGAASAAYIQQALTATRGLAPVEDKAQQAQDWRAVVGWVSYTTKPRLPVATDDIILEVITREDRIVEAKEEQKRDPVTEENEIVEVIVCRCGTDHKPPSGGSGCGYWAYLHLLKGDLPHADPAH
jgi:hypothetical protein